MSNNLKHQFGLAVESIQEAEAQTAAAAPLQESDLAMAEDGPIAEANAEVQAEVEAAGGLEQATVALEQLHAILNESLDDGGMSRQTARVTQLAVDMAHRQMGMNPSRLSFENDMPPVMRTRMTMESISESMKAGWKAFVAFCERIWNNIVNFFQNLTNKGRRIREQSNKLAQLARSIPHGAAPKQVEINLGELVKWMDFHGVGGSDPITWLNSTNESAAAGSKAMIEASSAALDVLVKLLGELDHDNSFKFTAKAIQAQPLPFMKADGSAVGEGIQQRQPYSSGSMPGALRIRAVLPNSTAVSAFLNADAVTQANNLGRETFTLVNDADYRAVAGAENMKVFSPQDIEKIAIMTAGVATDCEKIDAEFRAFKRDLEQKLNSLRTTMEKVFNTVGVGAGQAGRWNSLLHGVQRMYTARFQFVHAMSEYNLRGAAAYNHICAKMLEQYAGATASAAAPAAAGPAVTSQPAGPALPAPAAV